MKCPGIFIVPAEAVTKALEARDFALEADPKAPWYSALEGRDLSLRSLPGTTFGRKITRLPRGFLVATMERLGIAPKGTTEISRMLNLSADYFVQAASRSVYALFFLQGTKARLAVPIAA